MEGVTKVARFGDVWSVLLNLFFMQRQWIWRPMLCHTSSRMNWNRLTVLRRIKLLRIIDFKPKLNMAKKRTHRTAQQFRTEHTDSWSWCCFCFFASFFSLSMSIRRCEFWVELTRCCSFYLCVLFFLLFCILRTRARSLVPRLDHRCIMALYYRRIAADHTFFSSYDSSWFERSSPGCLTVLLYSIRSYTAFFFLLFHFTLYYYFPFFSCCILGFFSFLFCSAIRQQCSLAHIGN